MAAVTGKDIPLEQQLFNICWSYLKEYYYTSSDEEWRQAIHSANNIYDKFKGTDVESFAYDMITDAIKRIEQISADSHKKGKLCLLQ